MTKIHKDTWGTCDMDIYTRIGIKALWNIQKSYGIFEWFIVEKKYTEDRREEGILIFHNLVECSHVLGRMWSQTQASEGYDRDC